MFWRSYSRSLTTTTEEQTKYQASCKGGVQRVRAEETCHRARLLGRHLLGRRRAEALEQLVRRTTVPPCGGWTRCTSASVHRNTAAVSWVNTKHLLAPLARTLPPCWDLAKCRTAYTLGCLPMSLFLTDVPTLPCRCKARPVTVRTRGTRCCGGPAGGAV